MVLCGVWLIYFSFGLTISALAPLVTYIIKDFELTHTRMGSILGAWQFVYFFAAIPCGILVDRIGPARALLAACLIMALSGFARSLATNEYVLFLAVALFGIGGPLVSSGAPKMIATWFSGAERARAMGIYITGPALAGMLTLAGTNSVLMPLMSGSWRAILALWATAATAAAILWLIIIRTRQPIAPASQPVPPPDRSRKTFLAILGLPDVRLVLVIGFCIFAFLHGLTHWQPAMLRHAGMSNVEAGYWAALPTFVGLIGALIIPRFATAERRLAILAVLAVAASLAAICLQAGDGPVLAAGLILQGIARSSLMTIAILTLIELPGVGTQRAGTATGLFFVMEGLGGTIGPLAVGALRDITGTYAAGLVLLSLLPVIILAAVGGLQRLKAARRPAAPASQS